MGELPLHGWENYYVILGSSAAALTGLTFIVITISSGEGGSFANSASARLLGLRAFITPIAVHFCAALWLSVLLSVPGLTVTRLAICLGITGVVGVMYCARVIGWMLQALVNYKPFLDDWIWNAFLPSSAYLCVLVVALILRAHTLLSLYLVAAVTVVLLFVGIHNAWDVVAWITTERHARKYERRDSSRSQASEGSDPPSGDTATESKGARHLR